jgi:hypothetical protein
MFFGKLGFVLMMTISKRGLTEKKNIQSKWPTRLIQADYIADPAVFFLLD